MSTVTSDFGSLSMNLREIYRSVADVDGSVAGEYRQIIEYRQTNMMPCVILTRWTAAKTEKISHRFGGVYKNGVWIKLSSSGRICSVGKCVLERRAEANKEAERIAMADDIGE
jgi:hypothetical protein